MMRFSQKFIVLLTFVLLFAQYSANAHALSHDIASTAEHSCALISVDSLSAIDIASNNSIFRHHSCLVLVSLYEGNVCFSHVSQPNTRAPPSSF